ncbi:hypothetical protein HaLaN_24578, partial [Haematococcus lacustris]
MADSSSCSHDDKLAVYAHMSLMKQHFSIVGSFTAMHRIAPGTPAKTTTSIKHIEAPSMPSVDSSQQDPADTLSGRSYAEEDSRMLPVSDQDKVLSLQ